VFQDYRGVVRGREAGKALYQNTSIGEPRGVADGYLDEDSRLFLPFRLVPARPQPAILPNTAILPKYC
ncbi:MAG TPA: hypothetical protein VF117_05390, partial [Gammaproteobacteria bacterium]